MRGARTHQKDGSDLIGVCRECHNFLHSNNTKKTRELVEIIIAQIKARTKEAREECEDVVYCMWERLGQSRYTARRMHEIITYKKV